MPGARKPAQAMSALASLSALLQPALLLAASIAALVSVATFSFFTYISPFLLQVSGLDAHWLGTAMLSFGVCAIGGNLLGGHLADGLHARGWSLLVLAALALNLLGFYLLRTQALAMLALCGSLGLLFFAIVTLSTMRLLNLARRLNPGVAAVAAGLNIASFNLGTAAGGLLGGALIAGWGLSVISLGGMIAALLAMLLLWRTS